MRETILTDKIKDELERLSGEGLMYGILEAIENFAGEGVEKGYFTKEDVLDDMEISLWIAYADMNIAEYDRYVHAEKWLKRTEIRARGCGVWYYRYSVALMYLGRPDEALDYAEKGAQEEPAYPWIWLQLAALRAHAGRVPEALSAIEKGLELVPGDYEFLRRRGEIEAGRSLEEMENHYIDEDADRALSALDENSDNRFLKNVSVSTILEDPERLSRVKNILGAENWEPGVYCYFSMRPGGVPLSCRFELNEAGASKFEPGWLENFMALFGELEEKGAAAVKAACGEEAPLEGVSFSQDRSFMFRYAYGPDAPGFYVRFGRDFTVRGGVYADEQADRPAYSTPEKETVRAHIEKYFGGVSKISAESLYTGGRIEICLIPPAPERYYYTLVTCGMGAFKMNVPEELAGEAPQRAELAICLPADWKIDGKEEEWYWPVRCLLVLAGLPAREDSWLGLGHTVPRGGSFAGNTALSGVILTRPQDAAPGCEICLLPDGEEVAFYQIIPLYEEEMDYKITEGADALMERLADTDHVVDIKRGNVIF